MEFLKKYNIDKSSLLSICAKNILDADIMEILNKIQVKELIVPDNIKIIDNVLFEELYYLKKLILNDVIVKINKKSFAKCDLESIKLPENIEIIEEDSFYNCDKLKEIVLPPNLKEIGKGAFYDCEKLQEIILPDKLEYINDSVFAYCADLQKIKLNEEIKEIGEFAFYNCESLKELKFPKALKSIDNYAFAYSGIEKIEISSNIESIPCNSFCYCDLKEIIFEDESYQEKPGLQDFVMRYKDKIKIKDLDEIINDNSKKTKEINSKCMDELEK